VATLTTHRPEPTTSSVPTTTLTHAQHETRAMGGRLGIHVAHPAGDADADAAARDARLVAGRVRAWSRILTRHDPTSPLMRLNADSRATVPVRPTLAAALAWAADAGESTGGLVDATRLAERLAAESGTAPPAGSSVPSLADAGWRLDAGDPRRATVTRAPGTSFDLDGVGKGWLADRALHLLDRYPGAVVDADGDVAVRVAPGDAWEIGVEDPRDTADLLAVIVLTAESDGPGRGRRTWGVATSGTSVHRFGPDAHHLIDPRTGRPAATDVVQATVLASGAAAAEVFAKSAVILGSAAGLDFLDRAGVAGAILLLEDGRALALPRTSAFLA
jgi:thiamine biosynthesis lipoprotein